MGLFEISRFVFENSSVVIQKFISYSDSTGDRTSSFDFVHHFFFSRTFSVFGYGIHRVIFLGPASDSGGTIFTDHFSSTCESIVITFSLIDGTSFIGDIESIHVFIRRDHISSVASAIFFRTR